MLVTGKNVVFDLLNKNLLVFIHGTGQPDDIDMAEAAKLKLPDNARCLVITDGGGPTKTQRADVRAAIGEAANVKTAVVTNSATPRFIVAALSIFNPHVRAFSGENFFEALTFLDCSPDDARRVTDLLRHVASVRDFRLAKELAPLKPPANPAGSASSN